MSSGIRTAFRSSFPSDLGQPTLDRVHSMFAARFPEPVYRVRRDDATNTIWVSAANSQRELGVQPHTVQRRGSAAVLDSVASKLRA